MPEQSTTRTPEQVHEEWLRVLAENRRVCAEYEERLRNPQTLPETETL